MIFIIDSYDTSFNLKNLIKAALSEEIFLYHHNERYQ